MLAQGLTMPSTSPRSKASCADVGPWNPVTTLKRVPMSSFMRRGITTDQDVGPVPEGGPVPRPGGVEDGTFPYDGGPSSPVPMPKADPVPSRDPVRPAPKPEDRIVSLPAPTTQLAYPAYGEKTAPTSFAQDRPALLKRDPVKSARR